MSHQKWLQIHVPVDQLQKNAVIFYPASWWTEHDSLHEIALRWMSLMRSQHWFRYWLGAVNHWINIWANVDPDLHHHKASLGHNGLNLIRQFCFLSFYVASVSTPKSILKKRLSGNTPAFSIDSTPKHIHEMTTSDTPQPTKTLPKKTVKISKLIIVGCVEVISLVSCLFFLLQWCDTFTTSCSDVTLLQPPAMMWHCYNLCSDVTLTTSVVMWHCYNLL